MTNEEQNIAMLQALGFKHGKEPEHPHRDIWIKSGKAILEIDVADFGDDLNAIRLNSRHCHPTPGSLSESTWIVERLTELSWKPEGSHPKDARLVRIRMKDGLVYEKAYWVSEGWFIWFKGRTFIAINPPLEWARI